ncbi:protein kinase [Heterostelium album PN500]|uniref:Protein kinase n=1 Tax=Heterostelium pallidum (strain ATCC 26659 / Pp 5 / PN500) TaxID=670386 RepID=D3BK67_HETP5|nr:protein kinase [Heterostelium album PN500]EFA78297.1 protein kinase [Heterostelium album PN500]|eukprot:XP_020430422.1 protein kinase [Heterostelium album PN500]
MSTHQVNFEHCARRCFEMHNNNELNALLQIVTEIRDNIEVIHSSEYSSFLQFLFPVFYNIVRQGIPVQFDANSTEQKIRNIILEILNKLPNNELLRPQVQHLLQLSMYLLEVDNEDNAIICLRIIMELHKNYRPNLDSEVQPFLNIVQKMYSDLPATVDKLFKQPPPALPVAIGAGNATTTSSTPGITSPTGGGAVVVATTPTGAPTTTTTTAPTTTTAVAAAANTTSSPPLAAPGAGGTGQRITPIVSVVGLSQRLQVHSADCQYALVGSAGDRSHHTPRTLRRLYRCASQDTVVPRVHLEAAHGYGSSVYRHAPQVRHPAAPIVSGTVVGHSQGAAHRNALHSLVGPEDPLHQLPRRAARREDPNRNIKDIVRNTEIHRLLEFGRLYSSYATRVNTDAHRQGCDTLLETPTRFDQSFWHSNDFRQAIYQYCRIFESFINKFVSLKKQIPHLLKQQQLNQQQQQQLQLQQTQQTQQQQTQQQQSNVNTNEDSSSSSSTSTASTTSTSTTTTTTTTAATTTTTTATATTTTTTDTSGGMPVSDPVKDCRGLLKCIIGGFRNTIWALNSCPSQRPIMTATGQQNIRFALPPVDESLMYIKLFKNLVKCLPIYGGVNPVPNEEKENLEHYANTLLQLDYRTFQELFTSVMGFLYEKASEDPTLLIIPQVLLISQPIQTNNPSKIFSEILAPFLNEKLKNLTPNDKPDPCLIRLLKHLFGSVQNLAVESKHSDSPHYFMLLKIIFRNCAKSDFHKDITLLFPAILETLNELLTSSYSQEMIYLFIELTLIIPLRTSSFLPCIHLLVRPLIMALQSNSSDLLSIAFSTIEVLIDNITGDFLLNIFKEHKSEFLHSIWIHLKPTPYFFGPHAVRVLGKMAGKSRTPTVISGTPLFTSKQVNLDTFRLLMPIDSATNTHINVSLDKTIESATNLLYGNSSDSFIQTNAFNLLKSIVSLKLNTKESLNSHASEIYNTIQSNKQLDSNVSIIFSDVTTSNSLSMDVVPTSPVAGGNTGGSSNLNSSSSSLSITLLNTTKCKDELIEEKRVIKLLLSGFFVAYGCDALKSESRPFLTELIHSFFLVMSTRRMNSPLATGELNPYLIIDSFIELLSRRNSESKNVLSLEDQHGILEIFYKTINTIYGASIDSSDGSADSPPPICKYLIESFINHCYQSHYGQKHAGVVGIQFFVGKYQECRQWMNKYQTQLLKALLHVVDDLTYSGYQPLIDYTNEVVESLVKACSPSNLIVEQPMDIDTNSNNNTNSNGNSNGAANQTISSPVSPLNANSIANTESVMTPSVTAMDIEAQSTPIPPTPSLANTMLDQTPVSISSPSSPMTPAPNVVPPSPYNAMTTTISTPTTVSTSTSNTANTPAAVASSTPGQPNGPVQQPALLPPPPPIKPHATLAQLDETQRPLFKDFIECLFRSLFASQSHTRKLVQQMIQLVSQITNIPIHLLHDDPRAFFMNCHNISGGEDPSIQIKANSQKNISLLAKLRQAGLEMAATAMACPEFVAYEGVTDVMNRIIRTFFKAVTIRNKEIAAKFDDTGKLTQAANRFKETEEVRICAAIIDTFHLLPTAVKLLEQTTVLTLKLEQQLGREVNSPYRAPLIRFLAKYPAKAVDIFISQAWTVPQSTPLLPQYATTFRLIVKAGDIARPIVDELARNYQHWIDAMSTYNPDYQFLALSLINTIVKIIPNWLTLHRPILDRLIDIWRHPGRKGQLVSGDIVSPNLIKETRMIVKCFIQCCRLHHAENELLFYLLFAFTIRGPIDFAFLRDFYQNELPESTTVEQKISILTAYLEFAKAPTTTPELKVHAIQNIVSPLVQSFFQHGPNGAHKSQAADELLSNLARQSLPLETEPIQDETLLIELLQLETTLIKNAPQILIDVRKELIKFAWNHFKNDDFTCRQTAYVLACRFIEAYETPSKIVLQVYVQLLKAFQIEAKHLVKQALDILVPTLKTRLIGDNIRNTWIKWTKKIIVEESHTPQQLVHILQLIVRHPVLFYSSRAQFIPQMVSSLPKLGLVSNISPENKKLSIDLTELIITWEKWRLNPHLIPSGAGVASSSSTTTGSTPSTIASVPPVTPTTEVSVTTPSQQVTTPITQSADDEYRPPANVVEHILQFLIRLMTNATDAKNTALVEKCSELLRQSLSIWPDASIKFSAFEKSLASDQVLILSTTLNILNIILEYQVATFVPANLANLPQFLPSINQDNPKISQLICSIIKKMLVAFPLGKESTHPDIISFYNSVSTAVGWNLSNFEKSLNVQTLSLIAVFKEDNPDWIEPHLPNIIKIIHRLTSYLLSPETVPTIPVQQPANPVPAQQQPPRPNQPAALKPPAAAQVQFQPKRSEKEIIAALSKCFNLIRQKITKLSADHKKIFLQSLLVLLERHNDIELLTECLNFTTQLITQKEYAGVLQSKEKVNFILKMSRFGQLESKDLIASYFNLIHQVYSDPTSSRVELSQLESGFMLGLRSHDPKIRKGLFEILHRSISSTPYQRLNYIIANQQWDQLGNTYWIRHALDLLIAILPVGKPVSLVQGVSKFQSLLPNVAGQSDVAPNMPLGFSELLSGLDKWLDTYYNKNATTAANNVESSNQIIQTLLESISKCTPQPKVPVEVISYLGEHFNAFFTAIKMLEFNVLEGTKTPEQTEPVWDALGYLYKTLNEQDLLFGLLRRRFTCDETKLGLLLEQFYMFQSAQEVYLAAMNKYSSNGAKATSKNENLLWEDHWIECAKRLNQWEVLLDYARSQQNMNELLVESSWKLSAWPIMKEALTKLAPLEDTAFRKILQGYSLIIDKRFSDVDPNIVNSNQLILKRWVSLPERSFHAHNKGLIEMQQVVELQEAVHLLKEVTLSSLPTNQPSRQVLANTITDVKAIFAIWRERLPSKDEDTGVWNDLLTWRQQVFSLINQGVEQISEFMNVGTGTPNKPIVLPETAWTTNKYAHVNRKHHIIELCLNSLSKMFNLQIEVQDIFLNLKEQIKCYLQLPTHYETGISIINGTNLDYFLPLQKSEFFQLKGEFQNRLGRISEANLNFSTAIQLFDNHSKSWVNWGYFCDKQFTGETSDPEMKASWAESAINCYIQGIRCDPRYGTKLLPRILWLLYLNGCGEVPHNIPVPAAAAAANAANAANANPGAQPTAADGTNAADPNTPATPAVKKPTLAQTVFSAIEKTGSLIIPHWLWLSYVPTLITGAYMSVQFQGYGFLCWQLLSKICCYYPNYTYYHFRKLVSDIKLNPKNPILTAPVPVANPTGPSPPGPLKMAETLSVGLQPYHSCLISEIDTMLNGFIQLANTIPAVHHFTASLNHILLEAFRIQSTEEVPTTIRDMIKQVYQHYFCGMVTTLENTTQLVEEYKSQFEVDFIETEGQSLSSLIVKLIEWVQRKHSVELCTIYTKVDSSTTVANYYGQNSTVRLDSLVPTLASLRPTLLEVPSIYRGSRDPSGEYNIKVERIGLTAQMVKNSNGMLCPRVTLHGINGNAYPFLIDIDTPLFPAKQAPRTSERRSQFLCSVNNLLLKYRETRRRGITFNQYPTLIPINNQMNLTQAIGGNELTSLIKVWSNQIPEQELYSPLLMYRNKLLGSQAATSTTSATPEMTPANGTTKSHKPTKLQAFREMSKYMTDTLFSNYIQRYISTYQEQYEFKLAFASQWGLHSLISYILFSKIATLSPSDIYFSRTSGTVYFGKWNSEICTSENSDFNEHGVVPFRLTQNIRTFLNPVFIEGGYQSSLLATSMCLSESKDQLVNLLSCYLFDEILCWYISEQNSQQQPIPTAQLLHKEILDKTVNVVNQMLNARINIITPPTQPDKTLFLTPIIKKVNELIQLSSNSSNISQMESISYPCFEMENNDKTSNIDCELAKKVLKNKVLLYNIVVRLPLFELTKRNCVIYSTPVVYSQNIEWTNNNNNNEEDKHGDTELRLIKDIYSGVVNCFCWSKNKVRHISGGFIVRFDFKMGKDFQQQETPPADGFAFVIHNDPRGTSVRSSLTHGGSGLGYTGIGSSIAVEFDDYQFSDDPNDNHIAVHTNGVGINSSAHKYALSFASPSFKLCDFNYHQVEIIYEPFGKQLIVRADHNEVVKVNIDINNTIGIGEDDSAYVGFTAACGEYTQNVFIKNCSIYRY